MDNEEDDDFAEFVELTEGNLAKLIKGDAGLHLKIAASIYTILSTTIILLLMHKSYHGDIWEGWWVWSRYLSALLFVGGAVVCYLLWWLVLHVRYKITN